MRELEVMARDAQATTFSVWLFR